MENKTKDIWDKAEIILRALASLLAALAIAGIGFFGSDYLGSRQENELRFRLYTELISKREDAESALRKDMFMSIINTFLNPAEVEQELEGKILKLELLAYNFHESLNLMPLFEHLKKEISADSGNYQDRLEKIAREIIKKQVAILGKAGATRQSTIYLPTSFRLCQDAREVETDEIPYDIQQEMKNLEIEVFIGKEYVDDKKFEEVSDIFLDSLLVRTGNEKMHEYDSLIQGYICASLGLRTLDFPNITYAIKESLELDKIERDFKVVVLEADSARKELKIRLEIYTPSANSNGVLSTKDITAEFWVGFFDFPMIDNTRLTNDQRCAIVLSKFEYPIAEITLVYFPGSHASLKEKPYYQEVVDKLITYKKGDN